MPAEMNPEDLARDVGNDLFGDPPEGGDEVVLKGEPVEPTPAPAPEPISMPRAWKKEHETLWTGLQRPVQEYLTQREADVEKGFVQYAKGHKSWAELTSPFEGVLQQYPQVNPVQLMQGLMRNHLQMVQGSPEQRKALALQLLKGYGVDLNAPAAPAPSPEFQAVSNELRSLQSSFQAFQKTQQDQALAEQTKIVEAFATDPQNKYFSEVQEDIIRFIQTGVADSIQSA